MKVIFLDIDGVLNSRKYDAERDWGKLTNIDETRLPLVKEIVDRSGARIVLSSTWRVDWDTDPAKCAVEGRYINDMFARYGLAVFDKTPDLGVYASRADEVKAWLDAHDGIESFVIIDDDGFGWGKLSERLVKTSMYIGRGLERRHVDAVLEILNKTGGSDGRA